MQSKKRDQPPPPRNHLIFDPWNTGSTGHERVQHNYVSRAAGYRSLRAQKLGLQFRGVMSSSSLAAAEEGRLEKERANKQRGREQLVLKERNSKEGRDIRGYMGGLSKTAVVSYAIFDKPELQAQEQNENIPPTPQISTTSTTPKTITTAETAENSPKIFHSLTFYINGSTFPLISDYKLRHLVAEHGGTISMNLARRSVTHVIIARTPSSPSFSSSSSSGTRRAAGSGGGGLSDAKLQKEIATTAGKRGKGVKFVGVEWIIESVKAGKRLPEARFVVSLDKNKDDTLVGASRGQRSVYGMFKAAG